MGRDVERVVFTREDRRQFRDKHRRCLDVLAQMLAESQFDFEHPLTGMEIELNLVDDRGEPANVNARVLELVADPAFQTEMGQFNIEINVAPRGIAAGGLDEFEQAVRSSLNSADERARTDGAHLVMTGILPTLMPRHVRIEAMSANPRYAALNDQIFAARGEDIELAVDGVERLSTYADSITPEAACTSFQLHLQVSPAQFAQYWNAAQAIAGVQLAVGANSPFLFGKELWRETRIPLFEQATDTRPEELKEQGVRPRVWFGERWVTSVFDLFEENARYFPALLPICDDDDPAGAARRAARSRRWPSCRCTTARSTAGTGRSTPSSTAARTCAWRTGCCPPGRPSSTPWPTRRSTTGWSARWPSRSGRSGRRCRSPRPRRTCTAAPGTASTRRCTGRASARSPPPSWCCAGCCRWPTPGSTRWGVDPAVRDRLLGIIEGRCTSGVNGAELAGRRRPRPAARRVRPDRAALHGMLERYVPNMHSNEPVHTWER